LFEGFAVVDQGVTQSEKDMKWTEEEAIAAADNASSLSELLAQDNFFDQRAIRWLKRKHIQQFLKALDLHESSKLLGLAQLRRYPTGNNETRGFPLLDWLRVIGPSYDSHRDSLDVTDTVGEGGKLIARLAELQPLWVGRWWKWRCNNRRGTRLNVSAIDWAVIEALSNPDFEKNVATLSDALIAGIIGLRPEFCEVLTEARAAVIAGLASEGARVTGVLESLSDLGIPSDFIAVIDQVLKSGAPAEIPGNLDELVDRWKVGQREDPVAVAIRSGHSGLEEVLHQQWYTTDYLHGRRDKELWADGISYSGVGSALASALSAAPARFRLQLGFSLGVRIANERTEPSPESVMEVLKGIRVEPTDEVVSVLFPMAEFWATIHSIAKYRPNRWDHETELIGLQAKLLKLAAARPELWAESLAWIFARSEVIGESTEAVTLALAAINSQITSALETASHDASEAVRFKAQGLLTLLRNIDDPAADVSRTLADAAARFLDGTPVFPHPLMSASATWLGSIDLEHTIANGIRRAVTRFGPDVRDQGGDIEESLTRALTKELQREFDEARPRLKLLGDVRSQTPILTVKQRPTSKKSEEREYGCDLAWVLNADVAGRYRSTWVDLVQVKKSTALYQREDPPRPDSWLIKNQQLDQILKYSATASYWLIKSAGEVLVVPAKHLVAIRAGRGKSPSAETFTIGYNDVRFAAIPLEQYLLDLLIGQWIGTSSEDVIRFAQGDANIRPMMVIEITI
jgi:hypothetical protein